MVLGHDDMVSKNIMEDIVDFFLDDSIRESGMCRCDRCRADVRAFALNQILPKYVVTDMGDAFVRVNAMTTQSQADVLVAIITAIKTVRDHPRHD